MAKVSFRTQVLRAREDAIIHAVNKLLAEKGFDTMTVDEVAAEVGIAKASLYKHFSSKEELASAAMVKLLDRALEQVGELEQQEGAAPLDQLKAIVRWTLKVQWAGEMPSLPAQNSSLRSALGSDPVYLDKLMLLSDKIGAWITAGQLAGELTTKVPPEVILYTVYARACDPVLAVLKAGGQYDEDQVVDWLTTTCFDGLRHRA